MLYGAMNFPIRPVLQELEPISLMGFDYLELTMDPPQAHHAMIREQKETLLEALARHSMGLVCHLPAFLFTADLTDSVREASVKEMVDSLAVAAELHASKAVVHPSYVMGLGSLVPEKTRAHAMHSLSVMVEQADLLGIPLCLENMFPRSGSLVEPDDFVEVLERFPSLKLTLDVAHAHIGARGGSRSLQFLERFFDRLAHVHMSDNFGKEDNHLPIGAGTVDFPRIVKALKRIGYDDTITLEVFSRDKEYLRTSRERLAAMFASD